MLRLRRGVVVGSAPLTVEVAGERREAWADPALVGEVREGDEVIVNVAALDLGLGSGGFDIVHANLTRGLDSEQAGSAHVMKLNYTPLQHAVKPLEESAGSDRGTTAPVLVLPLHGHLSPAVWAATQLRPGLRLGYVQGAGGALPGRLSRDVAELRGRELIAGHVTAGQAYGGDRDAISLIGAIDAGSRVLGWDAILVGPGPGILGSATRLGHGGMAALDAVHAALALGLPTLLSPRMSGADPRPRHRGLSHHTATVLELALGTVRVPVPELDLEGWPTGEEGGEAVDVPSVLDSLHKAGAGRHDVTVEPVDLDAYASSGLSTRTMGRDLTEDPLFFAAALAAGRALGSLCEEA
ncbi:MAG: hypothetical protein QOJ01_1591 [Solirubrobacterales bacterium]|jgi:hypothetical protein|nr:hypothetical protein [Solirubrobacterales bacterium]